MDSYWWFDGETVAELHKQLGAVQNPKLKVLPQPDGSCLLQVTGHRQEAVEFQPLNFSHTCPPIC